MNALHGVFLFAIPLAVVGFFLSLFLPEIPLREHAGGVVEAISDTAV